MRCAEFESRLNDLLDERRGWNADRRLVEHARGCGECRNLAAAYEAVVVGLEQSRIPDPGERITKKVLADVAASLPEPVAAKLPPLSPAGGRAGRGWLLSGRVWAVAALAASVLLAVALRWAVGPAEQPQADDDRATAASPKAEDKSFDKSLADGNAAAPERVATRRANSAKRGQAADAYRGLAAETGQSFAVAMQLLPGVGGDRNDAAGEAPSDRQSDWMHGLSDGLKPVTQPTAGAVNSFLQLLAASDEGSRS